MELSENEWAEFVNGSKCHTFKLISRNKDEVILQKSDGNYLKLNSNEIRMGRSLDPADLGHLVYYKTINQIYIFKYQTLLIY
jgi:hypothetical protein